MSIQNRIAVIGAGISGCTVARELAKLGRSVVVFEKSRGAGGRMSTRRLDTLSFDHGAPAFEAMSGPFRAEVDSWTRQGFAGRWTEFGYRVGVPSMSALPRQLLEASKIEKKFGIKVDRLERSANGDWQVIAGEEKHGPFSDVIVTAPAPQALELLSPWSESLRNSLGVVAYEPCWVLLAAWTSCKESQSSLDLSRSDWGQVFSRITEESAKPGRSIGTANPKCFVFQVMPSLSRERLEVAPEQALASWISEAERAVGGAPENRVYAQAHLWRYARVIVSAGKAFASDTEAGLHACGDAFMGDGVENAWMSAISLSRIRWENTRGVRL